jgi:hypothetical protein
MSPWSSTTAARRFAIAGVPCPRALSGGSRSPHGKVRSRSASATFLALPGPHSRGDGIRTGARAGAGRRASGHRTGHRRGGRKDPHHHGLGLASAYVISPPPQSNRRSRCGRGRMARGHQAAARRFLCRLRQIPDHGRTRSARVAARRTVVDPARTRASWSSRTPMLAARSGCNAASTPRHSANAPGALR